LPPAGHLTRWLPVIGRINQLVGTNGVEPPVPTLRIVLQAWVANAFRDIAYLVGPTEWR